MHRVIMSPPIDKVIDHINHNGLDNRKINLRICSNRENLLNRRKRITKTNKKVGIYFINNRYVILKSYKMITLYGGCFKTLKEAKSKCKEFIKSIKLE